MNLYQYVGVTIRKSGGRAPSRRRPTGVRKQSPRALQRFYSLFSKKYAFYTYFGLNFCWKTRFLNVWTKCVDAPPRPALRVACPHSLPPDAPLSWITLKFLNTLQRIRDVGWLAFITLICFIRTRGSFLLKI